jgi:leucyl aminopeptidase (aminopeptidase T)
MAFRKRSSSPPALPGAVEALRLTPTSEEERFAGGRVVADCLGLTALEALLVAYEGSLASIAAGVVHAADAIGATVTAQRMHAGHDDEPGREQLRSALARVDASVMIAPYTFPRALRRVFTLDVARRRHAHLLGVTDALVRQSLRADWGQLHAVGETLKGRLATARELRVESPAGSRFTVAPDPRCAWFNQSGLQRTPGWTNLPAGEVASCPRSVDGALVPDGGIVLTGGETIDRATARRLTIRFLGGRVIDVEGPEAVRDRLLAHLDAHDQGRRVGQVAIGTNTDVLAPIGVPAQDKKQPGLHLVLGFSARAMTGASWSGDAMVNLIQRRESVWLDDAPLLRRGRFV